MKVGLGIIFCALSTLDIWQNNMPMSDATSDEHLSAGMEVNLSLIFLMLKAKA